MDPRLAQRPLQAVEEEHPYEVTFNQDGSIRHVEVHIHRGRLGRWERRCLELLYRGPGNSADLARLLGTHPQTISRTCRTLEGKGLVKSVRIPGQTLEGNRILRRFYTLNRETCRQDNPITAVPMETIREEAQQAQHRGLLWQKLWHTREQLGSPDIQKRSHGLHLLDQLIAEAQQLRHDRAHRLSRESRHPTTRPLHGTP